MDPVAAVSISTGTLDLKKIIVIHKMILPLQCISLLRQTVIALVDL